MATRVWAHTPKLATQSIALNVCETRYVRQSLVNTTCSCCYSVLSISWQEMPAGTHIFSVPTNLVPEENAGMMPRSFSCSTGFTTALPSAQPPLCIYMKTVGDQMPYPLSMECICS